nr:T cell receptor delta variable 3 [Molossus molossus]
MIWIVGFSLLLSYRSTLCNTVTQSSLDQTVASGSEVTLPCTYDTQDANPDLYWYRRRPGHSFQFILYRDNSVVIDAEFTQGRFSVQYNQTHKTFHLVISSVTTEDTATYYCAIYHGDADAQEVHAETPEHGLPFRAAGVLGCGIFLPRHFVFQLALEVPCRVCE